MPTISFSQILAVCVIAGNSRQFHIVAHHNVGVLWVELNVPQKQDKSAV